MAFKPGKDSWIMLDAITGTGVNISGYADSFAFPQPIETHEVSVFGTTAKQFVAGMTDGGVISMSGPLDVGLGTFVAALKSAQAAGSTTASVVYGPAGSVSGQLKQEAEVWVSAYDTNTTASGRVDYSCSLQITGAVTNGTW